MQTYKLDSREADNIRDLLKRLKVSAERITIDLKQNTLEVQIEKQKSSDLLNFCGVISKKRANELIEHISKSRREWDLGEINQ